MDGCCSQQRKHYSVLESFWKGQLRSKEWLIDHLRKCIPVDKTEINLVIHGGWNGVLSSMFYNSGLPINQVRSVDIDETCEETANMINKRQEMAGKFSAVTCDMAFYEYEFEPDIVVNTSTEHLTVGKYNQWFNRVPSNSIIVLQSNNYREIEDHNGFGVVFQSNTGEPMVMGGVFNDGRYPQNVAKMVNRLYTFPKFRMNAKNMTDGFRNP